MDLDNLTSLILCHDYIAAVLKRLPN